MDAIFVTNSKILEEKLEKNPIYYSNKKNKVPRNKFNQGNKRLILRRVYSLIL